MNSYPVTTLTQLEKLLFDAGIVSLADLSVIYDIKAGTTVQRAWQDPQVCRTQSDIHEPSSWGDKLHTCMRGEFFGEALQGCRRVLDVGCGEGFPSLYLATLLPEVVGIDVSPDHIALARNSAQLMGLPNVHFHVADIQVLPFADGEFDGLCFGGNVFTYDYDPKKLLAQLWRVLKPGGPFAFEQWPVSPDSPARERILWLVDGGAPILHYGAGAGLYDREYFIYLDPQSEHGQRIAELGRHVRDEYLTPEQLRAFEAAKAYIASGHLEIVQRVLWYGECRSLSADEFPALLEEAGFSEVRSWALPDAVAFARSLAAQGVLPHLEQADLRPCLRALVKSAPTLSGWRTSYVTCRKKM